MNKEQIDPVKLSYFTLLNFIVLYGASLPDAVEQITLFNGDLSLMNSGLNRYAIAFLSLNVIVLYYYYAVKLHFRTSAKYKNYSQMHLLGATLFGPITLLLYLVEFDTVVPGMIPLISSIGVILMTFVLYKSPQLIYTMPFQMYRLLVIEQDSGNSIFAYDWNEQSTTSTNFLFSSVLEGMNLFAEEVVNQGKIREIVFDEGVIMIEPIPDSKLYVAVFVSHNSPVVHSNLKVFTQLFKTEFNTYLTNDPATIIESTKFRETTKLVKQAFPYVPSIN